MTWRRTIFALAVVFPFEFSDSVGATDTTFEKAEPTHVKRLVTGRDPCIVYSYDANGNRQSQTITVSSGGLTPTWSSGTWGCFIWTHQ